MRRSIPCSNALANRLGYVCNRMVLGCREVVLWYVTWLSVPSDEAHTTGMSHKEQRISRFGLGSGDGEFGYRVKGK
jgi:hypothetical protein